MDNWVVTGASGFVGSAVLRVLANSAHRPRRIFALGRTQPVSVPFDQFLKVDLTKVTAQALGEILAPLGPLAVVHAAGLTPPASTERLFVTNTRGTACLLEALGKHPGPVRVVVAGSAAELGPVPIKTLPANEMTLCRPVDPYGLSKWAATQVAQALSQQGKLEVMVGRLFNPIGPGTPPGQVFGRVALELARNSGQVVELFLGGLESSRDFFDVRDAARALITLIHEGKSGQIYHVGSGQTHTVGSGIGHLVRMSGRSILLRKPLTPARPGPLASWASIDRIVRDTNWQPEIAFEQSLLDLWNECRSRLEKHRTNQLHVA